MISRRKFISLATAAALYPQNASEMIVRSARPEDLETPPGGFADFYTPIDKFFVRSHVAVPTVRLNEWRLRVEGHVDTPLTLTMDDLRRIRSAELAGVLECAGNGRAFFDPTVAGLQWNNGAVGNARWGGVPLAEVLRRAGVKNGAVEILFDGADVPIGTMADFQRTIPLKKAMEATTLLAYEMNGETLPVKHGFPLRAVVPGWAGDSWTKWVTSIRVLNEEFGGFWMKNAYLYPKTPAAPGDVVPPDAMSPVTSLRVKSMITSPENGSRLNAGQSVVVRGVAWSGDSSPVVAVDVSVDRGRTWKPARFVGFASLYGWRQWEFPWTPETDGYQVVLARARDRSGDLQPVVPEWNPSGYLWNAIARLELNAAPLSAAPASYPVPPAIFRETCMTCHEADVVFQQRLTRAQWERELNKMVGWGARLRAEDREALLDYLMTIPR